ncbi:MAG: galactosyldiacylglycerol synthase [Verrucomicrobiota bacterium]|nr:galactosyldiacylglycerol synthase [Verrucomicrobiota bacterium]
MKKILILTAGYGEGHNAAARGVRDGLARIAPNATVELHDAFAETLGGLHELIRKGYLTLINRWPRSWGTVYRWLDQKTTVDRDLGRFFSPIKNQLAHLLARFQPEIVVSSFPPYPYLLRQILGPNRTCRSVVVVTDSITVNAIWYRCEADYFLLPNEQSAAVLRNAGIATEIIKTFGFPVSPKFADLAQNRQTPSDSAQRVLYMINAGTRTAPELVSKLLDLDIELTVTVGRDDRLRRAIEAIVRNRKIDIVGWTDDLPRMLCASHLLIGKAGGATVQETIAARCPMIINHIVSGQEEGNARLIVETNAGVIAQSPTEVAAEVQRAFVDGAKQWREWEANISRLSRPRASLDIAEFLLSI